MESTTNESLNKLRNFINHATEYVKSSEIDILVGVGVLLVLFILSVTFVKKMLSKLPPGPIGLPLLGYIPFMSSDVHLDFVNLGKKYGDVFSLTLGTETIIVLNGVNSIKEAFGKPEFLGRPPHSILSWLSEHSPFLVQDVHVWKEQRRFVVHTMKDLGLGRSKIEDEIENEIRHFLDVLRSHKGEPFDVKAPLSPSMSNNICALVFGKRYDYNDTDRLLLDSCLEWMSEGSTQAAIPTFFPWTRHIPFIAKILGIESGMRAGQKIRDFFRREIENHRKTFNPSNIRDYLDGYLKEMDSKKNDPKTSFNVDTFIGSLMDLFLAGSETVRTSILWCIYIMAAYPEVQRKVQREMIDVLGPDRRPEFLDQRRLPYTHAVILEIMRWKTIVPLNIMRYTTKDTNVKGYHIPKNTIVMANFWAVHHDPSLWEEPDVFRPERFLSPDGTSVVKSGNFMPFSIGKRACPGEAMANMELFLYFASILREFDVQFPEGVTPTFDAKVTTTYRLDPFKVRFIQRK